MNFLKPGFVLKGGRYDYEIERVLGHGGFGITYLARTRVPVGNVTVTVQFAIKEHFLKADCERDADTSRVICSRPAKERVETSRKDFISEARRLHKVGVTHPNIVKVNEVFEANNTAYYVMEYLEGESLAAYVKRNGPLSEQEALELLRPIASAVGRLHAGRMTHLDIKPANIMLVREDGKMRAVLIDFGLSKHYDQDGQPTSTLNLQGFSDGYAPIEQYMGISTFSPRSDVYALGATLYFCLTGKRPAKPDELTDNELADTLPPEVSEATRNIVAQATRIARSKRPADIAALFGVSATEKTKEEPEEDVEVTHFETRTPVPPVPPVKPRQQPPAATDGPTAYNRRPQGVTVSIIPEPQQRSRSWMLLLIPAIGLLIITVIIIMFIVFGSGTSDYAVVEEVPVEVVADPAPDGEYQWSGADSVY